MIRRPPNPYVGPRALSSSDGIFGREREQAELFELLLSERIVMLYSPSGAGKSSLIDAALIPALRNAGFEIARISRFGAAPDLTPPGANRFVLSLLQSLEAAQPPDQQLPPDQLAALDLPTYVQMRRRPRPDDDAPEASVWIFDQFEDLLTVDAINIEAKNAFLRQLGAALQDKHQWALFAIREDYLAQFDPYRRFLPTRLRTSYRLPLLDPPAARAALEEPARRAGTPFSPAASEQLLNDLRLVLVQQPDGTSAPEPGPYIEPVQLQVVCRSIWERLPPGVSQIAADRIGASGSVDEALSTYYASSVAEIAAAHNVSEWRLREWVGRLITAQGTRGQLQLEPESQSPLPHSAIWALVDSHLLRSEQRRTTYWFELAHDRLIGPVVADNRRWREQNAAPLQWQAEVWSEGGRRPTLLLGAGDLAAAESWAAAHPDEMGSTETEFLRASQERNATRRTRRIFGIALVGVLVVALLVVLLFYRQAVDDRARADNSAQAAQTQQAVARAASTAAISGQATALAFSTVAAAQQATAEAESSRADLQTAAATSRELALQALRRMGDRLDLALLLAVRAEVISETVEARSSLLTALQATQGAISLGDSPSSQIIRLDALANRPQLSAFLCCEETPAESIAISPDGKQIATGGEDGKVWLWDSTRRDGPRQLGEQSDVVSAVAFNNDGSLLASGSWDGTVRLWNPASGQGTDLGRYDDLVQTLAFSPDGRRLVVGLRGETGLIAVWDVASRQETARLATTAAILSIAFAPSGDEFATAHNDGSVWLWPANATQPSAGTQLLAPTGTPKTSIAFSHNGDKLAAGGSDAQVWLLDRNSGKSYTLSGHTDEVSAVLFAHDDQELLTAGHDRRVVVWDVSGDGGVAMSELRGFNDEVRGLALAADGRTLATLACGRLETGGACVRADVRLWDLSGNWALRAEQDAGPGAIAAIAASPDGKTLATAGASGTIRLWDLPTGTARAKLTATESTPITSLAVSPDSRLLASGDADGTVTVWDLETGQPQASFRGHSAGVSVLEFSPDGSRLLAAGHDGQISTMSPDGGKSSVLARQGPISSMALSPDGQVIAAGGCTGVDNACAAPELRLWRADGTLLLAADQQNIGAKRITGLAYAPGGGMLAVAYDNTRLALWDTASGAIVGQPQSVSGGNQEALAFSPDGRLLVSAGEDRRIHLWYASNLQPLGSGEFGWHDEAISALDISPDGGTLASTGADSHLRLWDLAPRSWAHTACSIANRDLSAAELDQYLPANLRSSDVCAGLP